MASTSGLAYPPSLSPSASSPASSIPPNLAPLTPGSGRDEKKPKRGVRQLNEQQLAKKRQNDREAQRAIRERTKNQIEALEQKVRELESGQAYRQLQDLIHEKAALRAENEELRQRLESVLAIVEPALASSSGPSNVFTPIRTASTIVAGTDEPRSRLPERDTVPYSGRGYSREESGAPAQAAVYSPSDQVLIPNTLAWSASNLDSNRGDSIGQGPSRISTDFGIDHKIKQSGSVVESPRSQHATSSYYPTITDGHIRSHSSIGRSPYTPGSLPSPRDILRANGPPAHSQLPSHIHPTCQYDTILYDFITECRKRVAMGQNVDELLGPPYPDLTALLYPDAANHTRPHSLSNLLVGTLRGFTSLKGFTPRISLVITTFYIVRWLVSPTSEHYEMIPEHNRPIEEQIRVPHPIWVDIMQWPSLRAKLVYQFPGLSLEAFFLPYTKSLSMKWPASDDPWTCVFRVRRQAIRFDGDCRDAEGYTEDIRPLPAFEQQVRAIENWSVGAEFAEAFPWLASTVNVKTLDKQTPLHGSPV